MGLSGLSGTKWGSRSGLDGTPRECGGLSGTEDLCLLIRVSQVRNLYGLLSVLSPSADILPTFSAYSSNFLVSYRKQRITNHMDEYKSLSRASFNRIIKLGKSYYRVSALR